MISASANKKQLQREILSFTLKKVDFGGRNSKLAMGPEFSIEWDRYGYRNLRKSLSKFTLYLEKKLTEQIQAGSLSTSLFSMWLHCVDPSKKESATLMRELVQSKAYSKIDLAYHVQASHKLLFGKQALTDPYLFDPEITSRELLAVTNKTASPDSV